MKKFLLIIGIILFTLFANSVQAQVISCDSTGSEKNTSYANETVYVTTTSNITSGEAQVSIYIVSDSNSWANGTTLVDVSGGNETNTTNSTGHLGITRIWAPTLTIGNYDIVIDINRDGIYNSTVDYLDSLNTIGFNVIAVPTPTLTVSKGSNSSSDHSWNSTDASYNSMLQLQLVAGTVEDIKVNSIGLVANGTGKDNVGIHFVSLVLDDNNNGKYDQGETFLSYGQYSRDDGILILYIENGYLILSNKTVYFVILYTMANSTSNDEIYSFQLASVSASGANSGKQVALSGLPINSAKKTIVGAVTTTTTAVNVTTTTTSITPTTTVPPTTTTKPPIEIGSDWIYIILIVGLIPVTIVVIVVAILFFRKRKKSENTYEELKEKWKKY